MLGFLAFAIGLVVLVGLMILLFYVPGWLSDRAEKRSKERGD